VKLVTQLLNTDSVWYNQSK